MHFHTRPMAIQQFLLDHAIGAACWASCPQCAGITRNPPTGAYRPAAHSPPALQTHCRALPCWPASCFSKEARPKTDNIPISSFIQGCEPRLPQVFILNTDPTIQDPSGVIPLDRGHPESATPSANAPDTLLECLLVVVHAHGRTLSRQAAIDGLPLANNRLTPSLFRRAAKRAGFTSNVIRKPLEGLNTALFPAVLLLDDENACVLLGWQDDGQTARVVFPELGKAEALLPRDELAARYSGFTILARPEFRFDARAPKVGQVQKRHWFRERWPKTHRCIVMSCWRRS